MGRALRGILNRRFYQLELCRDHISHQLIPALGRRPLLLSAQPLDIFGGSGARRAERLPAGDEPCFLLLGLRRRPLPRPPLIDIPYFGSALTAIREAALFPRWIARCSLLRWLSRSSTAREPFRRSDTRGSKSYSPSSFTIQTSAVSQPPKPNRNPDGKQSERPLAQLGKIW
jgi:hypothetical protein